MSDIDVIVTESLVKVLVPGDADIGFVVHEGDFAGTPSEDLDSVLGQNTSWVVDLVNEDGDFITSSIEARIDGAAAAWVESNILTNITGVPLPVLAVSLNVATLVLSCSADLGWSWRTRRSGWG